MDRGIAISADTHASATPEGYVDYLDPQYREEYAQYNKLVNPHTIFDTPFEDGGGIHSRAAIEEYHSRKGVDPEVDGGTAGQWDSEIRRQQTEDDGVVAEVIFPNASPFAVLGLTLIPMSPDMLAAGKRAYNRWLADFCNALPGRRAGVAQIPMHDVDVAVAELEWAANAGLKGALLPYGNQVDKVLYDPSLEPFWSAAESFAMPVHIHNGASPPLPAEPDNMLLRMMLNASEINWESRRQIWFLIWSGVFERHPDLKFVITEAQCNWVPALLDELDQIYQAKSMQYISEAIPRPPSEYWHRQCYVGASGLGVAEVDMRESIGVRQIMFGTDYPHIEGSWPNTLQWLQATVGGIPEGDILSILGETAINVYDFDRTLLQTVADRVGPPIEALKVRTPEEGRKLALLR